MKYIVLVGDGMADYPLKELNNKTPLQVANTPNMDFIASNGRNGIAKTIPDNMAAGSDVANLNILGYSPDKYYTGRGPLEAANMDLDLKANDIAFRCNLITIENDLIKDYSAGHISNEESKILIDSLNEELSTPEIKFYSGVSYRHILVVKNSLVESAKTTPPHDAIGSPIEKNYPTGDNGILVDLIKKSKSILEKHPINLERIKNNKNPANLIWMWGQGKKPNLQSFENKYKIKGSMISAVDLLKGIAKYIGLTPIEVPNATGYFDTNYIGKAEYALKSLDFPLKDFVYVHVEAPDEAGHIANLELKIKAIEDFDEKVVGTILDNNLEGYKIMLLPDHYTPISVKTHTKDPVPFAIYSNSENNADEVKCYDEYSAKKGYFGMVSEASTLLARLMNKS
ncbi:MAG: cofactor-independent phosphoglycerate mutase [Methanosarcinales archaeon]